MAWTPDKLKEWHEQLMDYMLLQPTATYDEIAQHFGVAPMTVGVVIRSDLFQHRLRDRRAARQATVEDEVLTGLRGLAKNVIGTLDQKIKMEKERLGMTDLTETAEMALRGLGYINPRGAPAAPQQTTNTLVVISTNDLADARRLMREREGGTLRELPATG